MTQSGKDIRSGKKKAVALRYDPGRDDSPRVTAKGSGKIAERIIQLAREAGVPVREEADLVEVLSRLELNEEIPPDTYIIVAEILAWVYRINRKAGEAAGTPAQEQENKFTT
jgi:flagellar biosynthesis protein